MVQYQLTFYKCLSFRIFPSPQPKRRIFLCMSPSEGPGLQRRSCGVLSSLDLTTRGSSGLTQLKEAMLRLILSLVNSDFTVAQHCLLQITAGAAMCFSFIFSLFFYFMQTLNTADIQYCITSSPKLNNVSLYLHVMYLFPKHFIM